MFSSNPLRFAKNWVRGTIRDPHQILRKATPRECPVCGFRGKFISAGGRQEARWPNCASKERDRFFQLHLSKSGLDVRNKKILHFSPERPFWRKWRGLPGYVSGDIKRNRVANTAVDITKIQFPDEHFDVLICHHVLEHVKDDMKGMRECHRVLKRGGVAYFSVPINEVTKVTFEPPPEMPLEEVERICGWDHKRIYGYDFADRLRSAGFDIEELAFSGDEAERYRLRSDIRGDQSVDRIFMGRKH